MKLFKPTILLIAIGVVFLGLGVYFSDPRPFSIGVIWLLIASARSIFWTREKAN